MHPHDHDHHADHEHHDHARARWMLRVQALLIGGIGAMLIFKVAQGTLPFYVHVRYTPLITMTGAVLLLLALVILVSGARGETHHHDDHGHDHPTYSWRSPALLALLVPILLGLLVPAQALGSAALSSRGGLGTGGSGMRTVESLTGSAGLALPDPTSWTLLDWVNATLYEPDNPHVQGHALDAVGFVWQDEGLPEGQFMLSRFVLSCCTADGLAIGMPVVYESSDTLEDDQWVEVSGTIGLQERNGRQEAVIVAEEVTLIDQPAEPYLYP